MSGLARRAIRGLRWDYARTGVTVLAQLAYTAIMARLLEPAAFGTFALALVVLNLARHVSLHGIGLLLIQRRDVSEAEIRAAFTASLGFGVAAGLAVYASAPLVARAFGDGALVDVTRVLAGNLVLLALTTTAEALLHRRLAFRVVAVTETAGYLVGSAIGVALAVAGWGVWSLVASLLAQSAVHLVAFTLAARHPLLPTLRWRAHGSLWRFGSLAAATSFVEFVAHQLDTLLIGRALSSAQLGTFDRAALLIRVPVQHLGFGLVRVMFPALARMQDDVEASRRTYYAAATVAAAVLLPIGVGAAIAAPVVVDVVLGPGWAEAAPVFAALALASPLHMLSAIAAAALGALDRMRARLALQLFHLAVLAVAITVALPHGIASVAVALLASEALRYAAFAVAAQRWMRPDRVTLLRAHAAPLLAGLVTAAAVGGADAFAARAGWSGGTRLIVDMAAGGAALAFSVAVGPLRTVWRELRAVAAASVTVVSEEGEAMERSADDRGERADHEPR